MLLFVLQELQLYSDVFDSALGENIDLSRNFLELNLIFST